MDRGFATRASTDVEASTPRSSQRLSDTHRWREYADTMREEAAVAHDPAPRPLPLQGAVCHESRCGSTVVANVFTDGLECHAPRLLGIRACRDELN